MPIRPVKKPEARARTRPPVADVAAPTEAQLVTHAITLTVSDPGRLWEATKAVALARGGDEAILRARVAKSGTVDVGDCVRFLLEEAVEALAKITGAVIGEAETYLELYEPPIAVQPVATTST